MLKARLTLAALAILLTTGCDAASNPFSLDLAPLRRMPAEASLTPRQPIDLNEITGARHHATVGRPAPRVSRHAPHTTI